MTLAVVVEVVESAAQALVPDSRATESECAVGADGETAGVDGTGLGRAVELELLVGGNVTSAVVAVGEDTVVEGDGQDLGAGVRVGRVVGLTLLRKFS